MYTRLSPTSMAPLLLSGETCVCVCGVVAGSLVLLLLIATDATYLPDSPHSTGCTAYHVMVSFSLIHNSCHCNTKASAVVDLAVVVLS